MKLRIAFCMLVTACLLADCGKRTDRNGISDEEYESTRRALVGANRILVKMRAEKPLLRIHALAAPDGPEAPGTPEGQILVDTVDHAHCPGRHTETFCRFAAGIVRGNRGKRCFKLS